MSFFEDLSNIFSPSTTAATPATEATMSTITAPTPVAMPAAAPTVSTGAAIPGLEAALKAVATHANSAVWVPALSAAFTKYGLADKPLRMAAALGQFTVECGGFTNLVENTNYTSAERLVCIFPSRFPTIASTDGYVGNPEKIAERLYNGFQGRGCCQLTGQANYERFADSVGMPLTDVGAYCQTPAGAAASGTWFLYANGCLPLADVWSISSITRKVNGPAMLGNAERIAASNAARKAFGV